MFVLKHFNLSNSQLFVSIDCKELFKNYLFGIHHKIKSSRLSTALKTLPSLLIFINYVEPSGELLKIKKTDVNKLD